MVPDGLGENNRLVFQIVVPATLVNEVLSSMHGDLAAGHHGVRKTYNTTKLSYYWKGMLRDVQNCVQSCYQCNSTKKPTKPIKSELTPISPVRVGQIWAMDILGPLKESYSGN